MAAAMALSSGSQVGPYVVSGPLGAGGMGEVYRARDTRLGRDVALKLLPASAVADPDRLQRFEQEARATAALNHPNILALYDIGRSDHGPFLVTELLEGETLRAALDRGAMPARRALDTAAQVARGLAAAHERGIVHRDIKPDNLFVSADGHVKILDFGLVKLAEPAAALAAAADLPTTPPPTTPGVVLGTVGYMAPEQVLGRAADHRADIFALGVVLYELVTGTRAFARDTAPETMTAILKDEPPPARRGRRHASRATAAPQPLSREESLVPVPVSWRPGVRAGDAVPELGLGNGTGQRDCGDPAARDVSPVVAGRSGQLVGRGRGHVVLHAPGADRSPRHPLPGAGAGLMAHRSQRWPHLARSLPGRTVPGRQRRQRQGRYGAVRARLRRPRLSHRAGFRGRGLVLLVVRRPQPGVLRR